MDIAQKAESFDWDEGNLDKNWEKHKVAYYECEEVFFNEPLVVAEDEEHSKEEKRYYAWERSNQGRLLFLVLTVGGRKIRVIPARDINKKERRYYREKA